MVAEDYKEIMLIDDNDPRFSTEGMYYKEFPSLYNQIRAFALFIVQKAPDTFKEVNLLEQQVSEIVKNAIKHGNRCVPSKKIKVWYSFNVKDKEIHLIVQDEGEGFKDLEKWNHFFKQRYEAFAEGDFEKMLEFASFRTDKSEEDDGGNALFAAVEYWNLAYGFCKSTRNKVLAIRKF